MYDDKSFYPQSIEIQSIKKNAELSSALWCGHRDLNPDVIDIRPSNVRVCQFRHDRKAVLTLYDFNFPLSRNFITFFVYYIFYYMNNCHETQNFNELRPLDCNISAMLAAQILAEGKTKCELKDLCRYISL